MGEGVGERVGSDEWLVDGWVGWRVTDSLSGFKIFEYFADDAFVSWQLQITPMMNRELIVISSAQLGFIDFVVAPLLTGTLAGEG